MSEHFDERLGEHFDERFGGHFDERLGEHFDERLGERLGEHFDERLGERLDKPRMRCRANESMAEVLIRETRCYQALIRLHSLTL